MKETFEERETIELVRKAKSGDDAAFTRLVKKYEQVVFSFAFKVCRDKNKAAETLQDTFINVYRKLDQFDGRSKFTTWLYSIVVRNCLMKNRRKKIEFETISIDHAVEDDGDDRAVRPVVAVHDTPLTGIMKKELKEMLASAIQRLSVDYRIVFILRDMEGQTAEETAAILKLSVPAVKSRLRRARIFLRNELEAYMR